MRHILILMWKHYVCRKRQILLTLSDFLVPLVVMAIIANMKRDTRLETNNPAKNIDDLAPSPHWIMYTPESELTRTIMEDVGNKLELSNWASSSDNENATANGYFPLAKGSQIADYVTRINNNEAVVVFEDMSGLAWPSRLKYSIRMKGDFHTETTESLNTERGPNSEFGSTYGLFMRIQWAIDTSYIRRRFGKEVPLKLSAQEFPYFHTVDTELKWLTISIYMVLSLTLFFDLAVGRIVEERSSGALEIMKTLGGISLHTIRFCHFLNVLPVGIFLATMFVVFTKSTGDTPILPKTSPFLLWLGVLLYFITIAALADVSSYITNDPNFVLTVAMIEYVVLWLIAIVVANRKDLPYLAVLATGLLPHVPLFSFFKEVTTLEFYEIEANFSNITRSYHDNNLSILLCIVFMLAQIVIFYGLNLYVSLINPGPYGQALPWNFPCKRQDETKINTYEDEEYMYVDPLYFEPPPANTEVGIQVVNVSKVYSNKRVLKNVSLEVYKGEITVLLGHNGAGKTTLMNVITGMTSASEGKVYVNGKDTVTQKSEVRNDISLCTQQDLFFPELTVQEHIMFFTMLKKGSFAEARTSSSKLAEDLLLSDQLNVFTTKLSGGMKRRTQLACALAGDASVLVLDEPTSGLDVETRRELWDLLLRLRGDRTVLLTTHFMEEADALGDRVAALHAGVLRCFATTLHLKKVIGTGYRLTFTTIGSPQEAALTALVTSHVPDATLREQTKNTITYSLPATRSRKFPKMFAHLEAKKAKLGLDSIGVGVSSLDDVFLKLCSDVDPSLYEDELVYNSAEPESEPKKKTGIPLYMRQWVLLMKRQVKYSLWNKFPFFLMMFIFPLATILPMTHFFNFKPSHVTPSLAMNLDLYDHNEYDRLLYHVDGPHVTQADVDKLRARYPKVLFETTDDVVRKILGISKEDIQLYDKYVVGVEVRENDTKILYTTIIRHAAPVALNLLSNLVAEHYSSSDGNSITTVNDPIDRELSFEVIKPPKDKNSIFLWCFFLFYIGAIVSELNVSLPINERKSGARRIHIMSGCPAELYWFITLSYHVIIYLLGNIIPIVIGAYFMDKDDTINQTDFIGALVFVMVLGSMTNFAISYLFSFYFQLIFATALYFNYNIVFGCGFPYTKHMTEWAQGSNYFYNVLFISEYIAPADTMVTTMFKCATLAHMSAWCKILKPHCPNVFGNFAGFDAAKCCDPHPVCYYCIKEDNPGKWMLIMAAQFVVAMTVVSLTERGVFKLLIEKIWNSKYTPPQPAEEDEMVRAEKRYVSRNISLPANQIPDAMLVNDLHKNYPACCGSKRVTALQGVSFSIQKGECFGLLGVNGAGKSTCFKLLTAEEPCTRGNVFCNGYHLHSFNAQYLRSLAYCPQFFGLDKFLTGEENLTLVLTMRGFDQQWIKQQVDNWIHIVGLEKYAHIDVGNYSGGCVRRLGAAAALCSNAPVSLLDEPSTGVDVAARRNLWVALRKALRQQRAIVITSHSMDEMEALSSRIAILAGGQVRALGSAAALRAAHALGYAVTIKLKQPQTNKDIAASTAEINTLKETMREMFRCTLKDQHIMMLHYHINETLLYSDLFSRLESLREQFPNLIDDYAASATTLEEVFLSYAKEQHERENRENAV
ncbi:hypothetical protein PYW08_005874 [Mythimna loreyi]|uniref:Uncharacterized protein n=1 Tax=Mythimna loreyi TaxID=667449 RepID=A0ACC2QID7_9NEOP|nr:hypothetical protein PYW08_005874 [Mythimna loreyi]